MSQITQSQFAANLKKYYTFYTGGFIAFVIVVGILEQMGVPNKILGYMFLFATIMLYAGIGFMSKTADVGERISPTTTGAIGKSNRRIRKPSTPKPASIDNSTTDGFAAIVPMVANTRMPA